MNRKFRRYNICDLAISASFLTTLMLSGLLIQNQAAYAQTASLNVNVDANRLIDQYSELGKSLVNALNNLDRNAYRDRNDTFLAFEGNNCTQNIAGSFFSKRQGGSNTQEVKKLPWFKNDEARSVLIQNGKPGDQLRVWDSPKGSNKDDYASITIKKDFNGGFLCIGSFQQNFDGEMYKIEYFRKNGLDGKVSRVSNTF